MHTLKALNAAPLEEFANVLDGVFEHAPLIAIRVALQRPFATVTALHNAMMAEVRAMSPDGLLAFLNGHPPLSPKALADPLLAAASRVEQGDLGLGTLGDELPRFEAATAAYQDRFGFPFIVCARRLTPPFVLRALERRLASTEPAERETALAEIGLITRLRLVDRVTGPGMPKTTGHLSTHVLDTARGRAAEAVRIELFREGVLVKEAVTNQDGRTKAPLIEGEPLRIGRYELRFHVGGYFAGLPALADPPWYDTIPVRFAIAYPEGHYHTPLLLGAWSYTTYRGS